MEWSTKPIIGAVEQLNTTLPSNSSGEATSESSQHVQGDVKRETWYLWHCKLGHLEEKALKKLTVDTVGIHLEIPDRSSFEDCRVCQQLPSVNVEDVTTRRQSDRPLKLLHLHVSKPFPTNPDEDRQFVMLIVDDFTNYCQVYFCYDELDMLIFLDDFVKDSKNLFLTKVGVVQLEAFTLDFYNWALKWLKRKKIGVTTTIRQTRRSNPKAAQLLDILLRTAKALLTECSYEDFFWRESIEAAVCLFNASTVIDSMTPYEHWFGRRPYLEKISLFGTHVHDRIRERARYIYVGLEHNVDRVLDSKSRRDHYLESLVTGDENSAVKDQSRKVMESHHEGGEGEREISENLANVNRSWQKQWEIFINLVNQCQESARLQLEVAENNHHNRSPAIDHRDVDDIALQKDSPPSP